jgi:hypothetical protein
MAHSSVLLAQQGLAFLSNLCNFVEVTIPFFIFTEKEQKGFVFLRVCSPDDSMSAEGGSEYGWSGLTVCCDFDSM